MVIAVNTRLLIKDKLEGIGWFTYETLKRITKQHPEHQFVFVFDRPYSDEFVFSDNVKPVVISPPTRHPLLWIIWFEFRLKNFLKRLKPDLFFSPDGYLPLKSKVKSLIAIHDINFVHRPRDIPVCARKYYNYYFPRFAKKAYRIVTVSEYSKSDIVNSYSVEEEKIDVVYNGSNLIFKPANDTVKENTKMTISDNQEYFVFVGALHPRKNVAGLLRAFDEFKKKTRNSHKLIIVGEKMFKNKSMAAVFSSMEHSEDVIFLGRLSPDKLGEVIASACALTFVPFFEGFGIPLVEAMNCEIPILASNATSLPEIAGDAALYANPNSIDSIAEAMIKLVNDDNLRKNLIEKGQLQKQNFTWDKTADRLWKSIEKCLEG